jgi:GNAT superfamily N-acetyltransferase
VNKKVHHSLDKVNKIPKDQPFVQMPLCLFTSTAWASMSINCRRLIDFLIAEHLRHAGAENGFLMATYEQLVEHGIGRQYVNRAITEAEEKGLIYVERGMRGHGRTKSNPNIFALTFCPIKNVNNTNGRYYTQPPNDYLKFSF